MSFLTANIAFLIATGENIKKDMYIIPTDLKKHDANKFKSRKSVSSWLFSCIYHWRSAAFKSVNITSSSAIHAPKSNL